MLLKPFIADESFLWLSLHAFSSLKRLPACVEFLVLHKETSKRLRSMKSARCTIRDPSSLEDGFRVHANVQHLASS